MGGHLLYQIDGSPQDKGNTSKIYKKSGKSPTCNCDNTWRLECRAGGKERGVKKEGIEGRMHGRKNGMQEEGMEEQCQKKE
jgi:hypothetical protein